MWHMSVKLLSDDKERPVLKGVTEVMWIHNSDYVKTTPYDIYEGGLQVKMMDGTNQYI